MTTRLKTCLFLAPLIALAAAPAVAAVQPFASTRAVAITSGNPADNGVRYIVTFDLASGSDGLDPGNEATLLSSDPNPDNPFADQIPRFQVAIPPGCWVDTRGSGIIYEIGGLACGAEVRLFDPVTATTVLLNGAVTGFSAQMINRPHGVLKVSVSFDNSFDALADTNPAGQLSVTLGNDGAAGISMDGKVVTQGKQ